MATTLRQICTERALLCRSDNLNLYEEEYWNITANSTGISYDLNRSVKPWNYTQCAIADSQFFWDGTSLSISTAVSLKIYAVCCVLQVVRHVPVKYSFC